MTFNGAIATDATRKDDRTLTATVPVGATSGDLVITVSGLLSKGTLFQVIKTLTLSASDRDLLVGSQASYTAKAVDTSGAAVDSPGVIWNLTGSGATSEISEATAKVTGTEPGDAVLTASSGTQVQVVRIHNFRVDKVTLDTTELKLNVPPPAGVPVAEGYRTSGTLNASIQASDRADRAVVWSALPAELVAITPGPGGTATIAAKVGTKGGTAVVTARSADDDRRLSSASVTVADNANFLLEFE